MLYGFILLLFFTVVLFWAWFFWLKDKQEKEPVRMIFWALVAGGGAYVAATIVSSIAQEAFRGIWGTSVHDYFDQLRQPEGAGRAALLGIQLFFLAASEELLKFAGIRFFFYNSRFFNEVSDGIFYGIMVGLGFALAEDIAYLALYGPAMGIRVLFALFHPATAGLVGYFLGKRKMLGASRMSLTLAILAMTLLHMLNNWLTLFAGTWSVILFFGVTLLLYGELFILYSQAQKIIAVVYCVSCGAKNRTTNDFCTSCGKMLQK